MNESYTLGFMDKCAEMGVNPEALVGKVMPTVKKYNPFRKPTVAEEIKGMNPLRKQPVLEQIRSKNPFRGRTDIETAVDAVKRPFQQAAR
jgi:hypothetical protein